MAAGKSHRRVQYWYQTIILRLIDFAVMNTRAILKTQKREMNMIDLQVSSKQLKWCTDKKKLFFQLPLQKAIAYGLSSMVVKTEYMKVDSDYVETANIGNVTVSVLGPGSRLDNQFHPYDTRGPSRKQCAVHKSIRCVTNKVCVKCDTYLCNGEAFVRFHTMENYVL